MKLQNYAIVSLLCNVSFFPVTRNALTWISRVLQFSGIPIYPVTCLQTLLGLFWHLVNRAQSLHRELTQQNTEGAEGVGRTQAVYLTVMGIKKPQTAEANVQAHIIQHVKKMR